MSYRNDLDLLNQLSELKTFVDNASASRKHPSRKAMGSLRATNLPLLKCAVIASKTSQQTIEYILTEKTYLKQNLIDSVMKMHFPSSLDCFVVSRLIKAKSYDILSQRLQNIISNLIARKYFVRLFSDCDKPCTYIVLCDLGEILTIQKYWQEKHVFFYASILDEPYLLEYSQTLTKLCTFDEFCKLHKLGSYETTTDLG
jgi:hypothetical protein